MNDIIKHYRTLLGEALQAFDGETLGFKVRTVIECAGAALNDLGDRVNPNGAGDGWGGWVDIGWLDEAQPFFSAPSDRLTETKYAAFGTDDLTPYLDEVKKMTIEATEAYFADADVLAGVDDRWKEATPLSGMAEAIAKIAAELGIELTDWQRDRVVEFFPGTWKP